MSRDVLPPFEEIQEALRLQFNSSTVTTSTATDSTTTGEDPETRQKSLETELSELETLNSSLDLIISSFEQSKQNLNRLTLTTTSSLALLDKYIRILSHTGEIRDKLIQTTSIPNHPTQDLTEDQYESNVQHMNDLEDRIRIKKQDLQKAQEEQRLLKATQEREKRERREIMKRRLYGRKGNTNAKTPTRSTTRGGGETRDNNQNSNNGRNLFGRR
ncbi:hypothetical protein WICPIJ_006040 [Wickerhamomyces pijperi]|uniref:DASH complex subunit DUO1 n=1 Tax=Wickerhamomyces pijperi TaxID=599730 RepID=A0A9P8Q4H0_WICPI|nr:hypothetical protein WICPIJ_006040 [Wickerhamomyces pijperi]